MFTVLDMVMDILMLVVAVGCAWLGGWALLRPRRPPEPIQGPVWAVMPWGLGYVLLGVSLAVETVSLMGGAEPGAMASVARWGAGPLMVGSLLAAFVYRRVKRCRAPRGE